MMYIEQSWLLNCSCADIDYTTLEKLGSDSLPILTACNRAETTASRVVLSPFDGHMGRWV
jgi:hypothetical protein